MCGKTFSSIASSLTFQYGVHGLPVQRRPHPHEEQLLRPLRQIVHQQLGVGRYWFHSFVYGLAPHLGGHEVDGRPEGARHPHEAHPVAVAHAPRAAGGDLVVAAEAVADLKREISITIEVINEGVE